jgi:osmotically-inducible protein OsmY
MENNINSGWKRPGMRSSDYGYANNHDHSGKGPKNYIRKSQAIIDEACEILKWSPEVDASEIEVSFERGRLSLKGFVDSRHAKKMAERLLDHVSGVEDIQNHLLIKKDLDLEEDKVIARGDNGLYSQEILNR